MEDLPQLCELLGELFTQESDFKADREIQAEGLRLILDSPELGKIFVLRQQSVVIGMVNLLLTVSSRYGGEVVLLEDLVVHCAYRGSGAGSALLGHAIAFANSMNAKRITLLTDPWNERAVHLYQTHGFVRSQTNAMRWRKE
jgi:ribosomal protein S18 acetylase RimI-like enzyme